MTDTEVGWTAKDEFRTAEAIARAILHEGGVHRKHGLVMEGSREEVLARAFLKFTNSHAAMLAALKAIDDSMKGKAGAWDWINSGEAVEAFRMMRAAIKLAEEG